MLPVIPQSELTIHPVDWAGLPPTYLNRGELEIIGALVRSLRAYPVPKRLGHLALTMRRSTYRVDVAGLDAA